YVEGSSGEMTTPLLRDGPQSWVGSLAKIAGFFMFVGPPIGGVIWLSAAFIGGLIFHGPSHLGLPQIILAALYLSFVAIPFDYLFGLVPAALAGLIIGALQLRFGRLRWYIVVLVGVSVGIVDGFFVHNRLANLLSPHGLQRPWPSW